MYDSIENSFFLLPLSTHYKKITNGFENSLVNLNVKNFV